MAYPTNGRSPLLDEKTQVWLERRVQEIAGAVLLCLCAGLTFACWHYTAQAGDGWVSDALSPQSRAFGRDIAAPLMYLLGFSTYVLPAILGIWGGG